MKTKNEILALLEIAIVLCSVFLMALPAIAADQHVQKVSANTITTTTDRPTYEHTDLDVFGNANEDDTIDMRDTTYIKLVIFGKKPKTDLADANNDGKVSMLDVGQTKLIILNKEKELTFIDLLGEAETINKPIKRLANLGFMGPQVVRILNAEDILLPVVGGDKSKQPIFWGEISKWPAVGASPPNVDYEYILSLEPDAVQTNIEMQTYVCKGGIEQKREFEEKLPGIPIICLNMREPFSISKNVRTYGYILDREKEAEEFIDWFEGYLNTIKTRTDGLSEDEKPRVVFETHGLKYKCTTGGSRFGQALALAGVRNIVDEIVGPDQPLYGRTTIEVDPEWIVEQNPEYMISNYIGSAIAGYETDDTSGAAEKVQELLNRPELAEADAIKKGNVYYLDNNLVGGGGNSVIGAAYMGKLFHPDLFKDIDPQAIHQEYVDKFCHIEFDVTNHGVFIYPPLE